MKEMTKEERRDLWLKYLRYQWEFTRRNDEYRQDYKDYKETDDDGGKVGKQIAMAKKWGFAVDPDNSEPYRISLIERGVIPFKEEASALASALDMAVEPLFSDFQEDPQSD